MAENYLIVGTAGADIEFGTTGAEYTGIGTIVSASNKLGGDKLEIKGRDGGVIIVIYFNEKNECEIEVIFDSGNTIPERGDAIDLCGITDPLVDEVEHVWANEKERMLKIRATRYENLTLA